MTPPWLSLAAWRSVCFCAKRRGRQTKRLQRVAALQHYSSSCAHREWGSWKQEDARDSVAGATQNSPNTSPLSHCRLVHSADEPPATSTFWRLQQLHYSPQRNADRRIQRTMSETVRSPHWTSTLPWERLCTPNSDLNGCAASAPRWRICEWLTSGLQLKCLSAGWRSTGAKWRGCYGLCTFSHGGRCECNGYT